MHLLQVSCNALAWRTGFCNADFTDCTCSEEKLAPEEFLLCAAESTCRLDCQRRR